MSTENGGIAELNGYRRSVLDFVQMFKCLTENEKHEVMGIMIGMNLVRSQRAEQT